MTTLLTGASGFVGRHYAANFPSVALELDTAVDIRDSEAVLHAVRERSGFDAVLHLAAQSSVRQSLSAPMETLETNFVGTLNLLQALDEIGFSGTFLFVSSAEVYGTVADEKLPADEQVPLRPNNPYGLSKAAAEGLCCRWSAAGRFRIIIARPFNHIGPGQDERFVVPNLIRQMLLIRKGVEPPSLFVGDPAVTRDFLDVRDVITAYQRLFASGVNGETYNVCSGKERSLASVVESLLALANVNATMIPVEERMRSNEHRRSVGSSLKLRNATAWSPTIPFHQTLSDMLKAAESSVLG